MPINLSASRIKTLETCSFLYYVKYVLKLPDKTNKGAQLGTITHLILECLTIPRRHNLAEKLKNEDSILHYKPIKRLIRKYLLKYNLGEEEEFNIEKFCLVALNVDFFINGFNLGEPEKSFEITNGKYNIIGFLDKYGIKDGVVKIVDYKTSKAKFSGDDAKFNVQALMYSLAAKKLWPHTKKVFINFLFLKFPKSPKQVFCYSDKEIAGFETYLEYLTETLENFSFNDAISNFAALDYSKKRLCGSDGVKDDGTTKWICPYQKPFKYWRVSKPDGTFKNYFYEEMPILEDGSETSKELLEYHGCPFFNRENYKQKKQ